MKTPCPSQDELRQLLLGSLSETQEAECAQHLDRCEACQAKLEGLATAGTKLSQIVERLHEAQPVADSAYWPAIKAVGQSAAYAATISPSATPRLRSQNTNFMSPPTDPAYIGRLAHFDVMRVIGRGGMGMVLEAFDSKLQRHVALKVLDPDLAHDETARQRFCREARAAASITHENVIAVHQVEHAAEGELPYLVMQLISGETLEQRLTREKRLPLKEIVRIALQTVQGLSAAHAQGLTHRDIKPANILLEPPSGRVKLTDFGLARIADDAKLTRTGFVSGTPLYMAPEQALGEGGDARSDLFSLGVVLYEMCGGELPFQGNTPLAILRQITDIKHRPLRELNPDLPEWLTQMVDELLEKKPENRYQSASDLAEVLEYAWARMRSSSDELPTVCQEELKQRRARNRVVYSAIGAGLLALGLLAGMFLPRASTTPPAPVSSAEPIAVLPAKSGSVWSVSFDPASDTIAMAVEDGTVRLWDWKKKAIQETLDAHRGTVWASKFSSDGKLLATAGDDGLLKVWSQSKQEPLVVFEHPNAVRGLAFGSGGKIYAGDRKGGLHVWSLDATEALLTTQQAGAVYAVAISPDGKTLASAGSEKTIRLWNADTLTQRLPLDGHAGPVYGLSFNQSGDRLASAGWDGTIRIWDPSIGKLLNSWDGQSGDVWSVAFSAKNGKLATGGTDGSVRVWNSETGKLLATYLGHKTTVHSIAFNGEGSLLASGGRDGAVRIWKVD